MTTQDLKDRLNKAADRLAPVAGTLMMICCSSYDYRTGQPQAEHLEGCDCQLCQAFLATQECQNELERIVREINEGRMAT